MSVPTISTLPTAPQVTDTPTVFSDRANTFVAALSTLVSETNTTVGAINDALAGALVTFDGYQGDWSAGSYASGDVVRNDGVFYISLTGSNTQEPPDTNWQALATAESTTYDNSASGLTATNVQDAIDESLDAANLTGDVAAARITNALNAGGSAPIYACRAWVNFDGTGTVAIRESGNVSSITDNGTGNYTVNLTTAMPDLNYAVVSGAPHYAASAPIVGCVPTTISTITVLFGNPNPTAAYYDSPQIQIAIFR